MYQTKTGGSRATNRNPPVSKTSPDADPDTLPKDDDINKDQYH